MLTFCVKTCRTSFIPKHSMDFVHLHVWYGMMIDNGPKFYAVPSLPLSPPLWPQGQDHGLRIFMLKVYVKVFRTSLFPNLWWIWFMYGICMKILIGRTFYTVPSLSPSWYQCQGHGLRICMLKFYNVIKAFRSSVVTNPGKDLVYTWYENPKFYAVPSPRPYMTTGLWMF